MDMRALYYIVLPEERGENEDLLHFENDIKSNENKLNQNFGLIAGKIYEFEARLALLEASSGTQNAP